MKEIIYTAIFAALGLILVILLALCFIPRKNADNQKNDQEEGTDSPASEVLSNSLEALYTPGKYTTELVLGGQSVEIEVIVNKDEITSIQLVEAADSLHTIYPLLQPPLEHISSQLYETQSLEDVTYSPDSKYTSLVLLEAISNSLDKAKNAQ